MTTEGMWQMLSDLLDGEKLPDSLNKAIHDLCNGKAVVAYELTDEEIMQIYLNIFKSLGLNYPALFHKFAREVLKKASEK
jgi:hypothetical protein